MTHSDLNRHSATAAIAAALALSATPLAAQSADAPVIDVPAAAPQAAAAAPAPTIVVPDVAAAPAATSAPVVQPVPEAAEPAANGTSAAVAPVPTRTRTTVTRSTRTASVAPVAASAPATAAASPPPVSEAPPPAVLADPVPAAAPAPAPVQPTPTQTRDITGTLGAILLALLALAILAAGLLFFRRRHPAAAVVESEPMPEAVATPVAVEPVVAETAPIAVAPTILRRRDPRPVAGALPSNGAAVDLPATAPESYEERSALLERMVAAKPDRANPFTDRRARLHRARLILQSLGVTFEREPNIDLSQYPNNWPELQRRTDKAA